MLKDLLQKDYLVIEVFYSYGVLRIRTSIVGSLFESSSLDISEPDGNGDHRSLDLLSEEVFCGLKEGFEEKMSVMRSDIAQISRLYASNFYIFDTKHEVADSQFNSSLILEAARTALGE